MIKKTPKYVNAQVNKLIAEIRTEAVKFDQELRSAHREKITLPVEVEFDADNMLTGFTRNLSESGLSILTCQEIEETTNAVIRIYRMNNQPMSAIHCQLRWIKPFGHRFWISGWQFLSVQQST